MDETFYEWLERTRAVDRGLFWLAVLAPLVVALVAWLFRQRDVVLKHRHRWVMGCLAAPGLLILWRVYNAIVDRFGLDSLLGLLVNVCVFAAAAMLATGLRLVLRASLNYVPSVAPVAVSKTSQPAGEFRPYKPTLSTAESPAGYTTRLTGPASATHNDELPPLVETTDTD